jgi:hypothetical protein
MTGITPGTKTSCGQPGGGRTSELLGDFSEVLVMNSRDGVWPANPEQCQQLK